MKPILFRQCRSNFALEEAEERRLSGQERKEGRKVAAIADGRFGKLTMCRLKGVEKVWAFLNEYSQSAARDRVARFVKAQGDVALWNVMEPQDVLEKHRPQPFGASSFSAARISSAVVASGRSPAACATAPAASPGA